MPEVEFWCLGAAVLVLLVHGGVRVAARSAPPGRLRVVHAGAFAAGLLILLALVARVVVTEDVIDLLLLLGTAAAVLAASVPFVPAWQANGLPVRGTASPYARSGRSSHPGRPAGTQTTRPSPTARSATGARGPVMPRPPSPRATPSTRGAEVKGSPGGDRARKGRKVLPPTPFLWPEAPSSTTRSADAPAPTPRPSARIRRPEPGAGRTAPLPRAPLAAAPATSALPVPDAAAVLDLARRGVTLPPQPDPDVVRARAGVPPRTAPPRPDDRAGQADDPTGPAVEAGTPAVARAGEDPAETAALPIVAQRPADEAVEALERVERVVDTVTGALRLGRPSPR